MTSLAQDAETAAETVERLTRAVARARWCGLTWEEIGAAVGLSRQAAWERWRHVDKEQKVG